jgi:hypothetical protein
MALIRTQTRAQVAGNKLGLTQALAENRLIELLYSPDDHEVGAKRHPQALRKSCKQFTALRTEVETSGRKTPA